MYYVIKNADGSYLNEAGGFGAYENAARLTDRRDAVEQIYALCNNDCRVVGPCIEGEAP